MCSKIDDRRRWRGRRRAGPIRQEPASAGGTEDLQVGRMIPALTRPPVRHPGEQFQQATAHIQDRNRSSADQSGPAGGQATA